MRCVAIHFRTLFENFLVCTLLTFDIRDFCVYALDKFIVELNWTENMQQLRTFSEPPNLHDDGNIMIIPFSSLYVSASFKIHFVIHSTCHKSTLLGWLLLSGDWYCGWLQYRRRRDGWHHKAIHARWFISFLFPDHSSLFQMQRSDHHKLYNWSSPKG